MTTTTAPPGKQVEPPSAVRGRRPNVVTAYRWEMTKLAAQGRARYTLLASLIAPIAVVLVLNSQQTPPKDTLYGRYIHSNGFAMPLLILGFATQWIFPLLTALVAGDIFSSEDQHGTWKTVLTRSVSRAQLFWAKTMTAITFAVVMLLGLATSTIVTSIVIVGHQPLVGLSGQLISPSSATLLVIASWVTALAPLLGFTGLAILLSVRTRNSSIGIVGPIIIGLVMQLTGSLGGLHDARRVLLTTPFESWHGLLTAHRFYGVLTTGVVVSAAWLAVSLAVAYYSLRRRDITGG
jgi:ABC-2 type transport system permease protein